MLGVRVRIKASFTTRNSHFFTFRLGDAPRPEPLLGAAGSASRRQAKPPLFSKFWAEPLRKFSKFWGYP